MCDDAEAILEAEDDFKTAADRPNQTYYLKALDFDDVIVPGLRIFNLCRAKGADGHTCGL